MSFLRLLLAPRSLAALAVVVASCIFATRYSVHHHGRNAFETLYFHLAPSPLVHDPEHAPTEREDYLFTVPAPGALAALAVNQDHAERGSQPLFALTNLQVFQVAAVLLVLILFSGVPKYLRTGQGDVLSRALAGFALWVRDEMVYPVMGKEMGRKFLPYFLCVFFFVLFMNLMGLVPGSSTATASIFVTAGLALTTLVGMLVCGMVVQGPIAYWKNLVPHVPLPLWPLMFVVELIGIVVKPFALMIRLFANMTGGHMVVLSFMGLIFFFGLNEEMFGEHPAKYGLMVSPIAVAFGVFIMIIESFVALLQAFIFTQLSVIFIGASVHPEH